MSGRGGRGRAGGKEGGVQEGRFSVSQQANGRPLLPIALPALLHSVMLVCPNPKTLNPNPSPACMLRQVKADPCSLLPLSSRHLRRPPPNLRLRQPVLLALSPSFPAPPPLKRKPSPARMLCQVKADARCLLPLSSEHLGQLPPHLGQQLLLHLQCTLAGLNVAVHVQAAREERQVKGQEN